MKKCMWIILAAWFAVHTAAAQKADNGPEKPRRYKIIDQCTDAKAKVHMVVIDSLCYVSGKEGLSGPIRSSKIDPADIETVHIFKESYSVPEWKEFSALIPKYAKRLSSISIVLFKKPRPIRK